MRVFRLIALSIATLLLTSALVFAGAKEVDEAQKFYNKKQYDFAIRKLEKEITNPNASAKAHFILAQSYAAKGRLAEAQEQFITAVASNSQLSNKVSDEFAKLGASKLQSPQYREAGPFFGLAIKYAAADKRDSLIQQIGATYATIGIENLVNNQITIANELLEEALQIMPQLVDPIGEECLKKGAEYLKYRQYETADRIFSVAAKYSEELKFKVAEMYYEVGKECRSDAEMQNLQKALRYSNNLKGKVVSSLEKKFPKQVFSLDLRAGEEKVINSVAKDSKSVMFFSESDFYFQLRSPTRSSSNFHIVEVTPFDSNEVPGNFGFAGDVVLQSNKKNLILMIFFD